MLVVWGAALAGAETTCEPLDEDGFREIVTRANEAIRGDDPAGHAAAARALEDRIPCLTFVPSPTVWAEYLVGVAAVTYLDGGDWPAPLETALRVAPGIDRAVGPDHEIALWTVPPPPPSPGPVPSGATVYVDGVKATELPAPDGLHLVQVRADGALRSALLRDAPIPAEWFPAVEEAEVATSADGPRRALVVSVVGGVAGYRQRVDEPGDYAGDLSSVGGEIGASAVAGVGVVGPLGFGVDLLGTASARLDGAVTATLGGQVGSVGAGVAMATTERVEGDAFYRDLFAVPSLTAGLRTGSAATFDASIAAGWLPAHTRSVVRAGLTPARDGTRFRFGVEGRLRESRFVQPDSGRLLAVQDLSLFADVGVVWGRW